jgi:hypothetical protein
MRKLEENSKEKLQDCRCELREELLKEGGGGCRKEGFIPGET